MNQNILEVRNLVKHFEVSNSVFSRNKKIVKAVDGISFDIKAGETLGLVGESGCGKTTTARCILRAMKPTEGKIQFKTTDGSHTDLATLKEDQIRSLRTDIQMIFQDPFASLNPRMNIQQILSEPLKILGYSEKGEIKSKTIRAINEIGLDQSFLDRYPHTLSGGQRQRVSIARAMMLEPSVLILDEPTSALDTATKKKILHLLKSLQNKQKTSYLFISHDLHVISEIANEVSVLFRGEIIETGTIEKIMRNPKQDYTKKLVDSHRYNSVF